jgi:saccharopine dehydrogenase-like NADP-dependent oxidoreductase
MKVIVLGGGLVGTPMARDLASDFEVTVADINQRSLEKLEGKGITTIRKDLSDPDEVRRLVAGYDFVVSAVPGFMGFKTLKAVIEAGKNVVDIAFFSEDALQLDSLAREKGVVAITDCGVAPGMSNLLFGYAYSLLDETHFATAACGGLPEKRFWPYEYKAVFSPVDVIEEYVRPARFKQNGLIVVKEALSDAELVDVSGVGTLEAFNTDGLRSLLTTLDIPNMREQTLRYPGYIEKMKMLRHTGFFSQEEIEVRGVKVRPLDVTSKLLFPLWRLEEGDADMTVMKVTVEGKKNGKMMRYSWDMLDRYDPKTRVHSMARTTGYTATAALRLVVKGLYKKKGLTVPEYIGRQKECVDFILEELRKRNVIWNGKVEEI